MSVVGFWFKRVGEVRNAVRKKMRQIKSID